VSACLRHLHWMPCNGKHQRYDGEPCLVTDDPKALAVLRDFHSGRCTEEQARQATDTVETRVVDQRNESCVES
jgi:hypothetical protein